MVAGEETDKNQLVLFFVHSEVWGRFAGGDDLGSVFH